MRMRIGIPPIARRAGARLARLFSPRRLFAAYRALSRRERMLFVAASLFVVIGIGGGIITLYLRATTAAPAYGGTLTEGVVGKPFAINPFVPDGSAADSALEQLVFSSLFKADGNGNVMPDLAETYEVLEQETVYVVSLRQNLQWHDATPLTAEDVLFTVQLIKNPEANHPLYSLFRDVQVEVLTPRSVSFTLPKAFAFFPQYLTFKIIPKHLWGSVPLQNFAFSEYSLKPVGAGPYQYQKVISTKDGMPLQYLLAAAPAYHLEGPYLRSIAVRFYSSLDEAMEALRKKEIDSLADVPAQTFKNDAPENFQAISPVIPQSFGIFFNMDAPLLQDKAMRQAIRAALPIETFFADAPLTAAERIDSPVWFIAPGAPAYDQSRSEELLTALGWSDTDGDGTKDKKLQKRDKTPTPLELSLTLLDAPDAQLLGSRIQEALAKAGVRLTLKPADINEFHSRLRSNSFQLLLVGELPTSGYYPDLYPFLHSTQKPPQGMNFSSYASKDMDRTLSALRAALDPETRALQYEEIVRLIQEDAPAVFMYRPTWTWLVHKSITVPPLRFLNSADERLSRVNEWYLFTRRVWN